MPYSDDYWFRHGLPFGFIFGGGKRSKNSDMNSIWTKSHYVPSLGAEFFSITASPKAIKKQNKGGGLLNSFIRPIIT